MFYFVAGVGDEDELANPTTAFCIETFGHAVPVFRTAFVGPSDDRSARVARPFYRCRKKDTYVFFEKGAFRYVIFTVQRSTLHGRGFIQLIWGIHHPPFVPSLWTASNERFHDF